MVQVTTTSPAADIADIEHWFDALVANRAPAEADVIRRAWSYAQRAHAGQTRVSGEPYIWHVAAVAHILAELGLDYEVIAAAILHDVVEDTRVDLDELTRAFGPRIAALVDGVTKMKVIQEFQGEGRDSRRQQAQAESLRKMLLAMAEDVRVVFIKLADRLHNMRTLSALSEDKQRRIARETMDVFAPLANRLGIWQLKWELEDLAFRYLEPVTYKRIAGLLAERRVDREAYIERFVQWLSGALKEAGIADADVSGRPKHIYSIWRKMQRKSTDFERIYDVRAVRLLANNIRDCYGALGVVHSAWQHVPGEFDDYIATPKENNYQSIHTAVIGPEGKTVEVQIRTHEMHQQSELGVAAHWRYKEGKRGDKGFDDKIAWLRSLLEWKDEVAEATDFVDQFKAEVFAERVYVFTPKGNIVDLQAGATPLDFAYSIHTNVGHRCRGAKVNGQMVPLTHTLSTGDRVEVLTVKEGNPSRDWLSPHLNYLHTSKARAKVSQWFRQQNYDISVTEGRAALEREFDRLGIADVNYDKLADRFKHHKTDDFLAAIGRGEIKSGQIMLAVQELVDPAIREVRPVVMPRTPMAKRKAAPGVSIQGVGNLLTRMAKCCNPLPGDRIVGFITRGQGITIHRQDCSNALRHHNESDERLVAVSWGGESDQTYPVDIDVIAHDRPGLLRDITALFANEKINVHGVNTITDKQHVAHMTFTLEIPNVEKLSRILALIDQVPNVTQVRRKTR